MGKTIHENLSEMEAALFKIKRLMPEVEAQISLMGGVGTAQKRESEKELKIRIKKHFFKTTKVK